MLIAGAKRHAKEILQILVQINELNNLLFFDDLSLAENGLLFEKFKILNTLEKASDYFVKIDNRFALGLGNPKLRKLLADKLENKGGKLVSVISNTAFIGSYNVSLGNGLNIMNNVMISNDVSVGAGTLVNAYSSIHHDVNLGEFCEVSPHAVLLGGVSIGNFTSIGANATILPDVKVGSNVIIGAGAVVTKNIPDNCTAVGIPAHIIKNKLP